MVGYDGGVGCVWGPLGGCGIEELSSMKLDFGDDDDDDKAHHDDEQ